MFNVDRDPKVEGSSRTVDIEVSEFLLDDGARWAVSLARPVTANPDFVVVKFVHLLEMDVVHLSAEIAGGVSLGDPLVEQSVEDGMMARMHVRLELGIPRFQDGRFGGNGVFHAFE